MSNNYINIDYAMNMIKENLVRDLSDSVTKISKNNKNINNDLYFSRKYKD